jgi:hypothetical protein
MPIVEETRAPDSLRRRPCSLLEQLRIGVSGRTVRAIHTPLAVKIHGRIARIIRRRGAPRPSAGSSSDWPTVRAAVLIQREVHVPEQAGRAGLTHDFIEEGGRDVASTV